MIDNKHFADRCKQMAEKGKTLYVLGGWGQKLTADRKSSFIKNYSFNTSTVAKKLDDGSVVQSDRKATINAAATDVQAFDCNCFVKAMLDSDDSGNIHYAVPCPDVTIVQMLKDCTDVSTDMSKVKVGELLTFADKSHCAVYIGNGQTVEALWHWRDGVQIRPMDSRWKYHGKMTKYLEYTYEETKEKSFDEDEVRNHLNSIRAEVDELEALLLGR